MSNQNKRIIKDSRQRISLTILMGGAIIYMIAFAFIGINRLGGSHALGTVVTVPSVINGINIQGCPSSVLPPDDPAELITQWINNQANVPNGTPGDPTIVTFTPGCYDTEGTIFFDGVATIPNKDGDCARGFSNPSVANCALIRHDIVIDGSGAEFNFYTDGHNYRPSPGEDYFGDNGYGFSYEDMKWYILGGANLTFQNINLQGPSVAGSQYFVSSDGAAGMEISGVDHLTLQNNDFSNIFGDFVTMIPYHPLAGDAFGPDTNITIQNNNFTHAGRMGISPDDVNGVLIQHNVVDDVHYDMYDLEADSPGWEMDNITINGDTDGGYKYYWFADNAGASYSIGDAGNSENILVENDTVNYAIFAEVAVGGTCDSKPVNNIEFLNNHGDGSFSNGYQSLFSLRCSNDVTVEGNYNKDSAYYMRGAVGVGSDNIVTIENNTFPWVDQPGTQHDQNPSLLLIGPRDNPTNFQHCGNNISYLGTGIVFDGSCQTTPQYCPVGEIGTPPNCSSPPSPGGGSGGTSSSGSGNSSSPTTPTSPANQKRVTSQPSANPITPASNPNSYELSLPSSINLSTVEKVVYAIDGEYAATVTSPPFSYNFNLSNLSAGCHKINKTIYFKNGSTSTTTQQLCINGQKKNQYGTVVDIISAVVITLLLTGLVLEVWHNISRPPWLKHKADHSPTNPKVSVSK